MHIGEKIRKFRKLLDLSRKEFASKAGISASILYYIERDYKRIPSQQILDRIFETYDINPKSFLNGIVLNRNSRKIDINKEWLIKMYIDYCLTTEEIASEVGCSRTTILERMREYGIPRRPKFGHSEVKHSKTFDDYPKLINLLKSGYGEDFLKKAEGDGIINNTRCFVIKYRIGSNLTLEDIARKLALIKNKSPFTREWVRQLQNKALKDLNNYLHN